MRRTVLVAAGGLAILLAAIFFLGSSNTVETVKAAVEAARSTNDLNEALADSAPQQQVVAIWHNNALLEISINQAAAQTADVISALAVLMGVVGLLTVALGLALPVAPGKTTADAVREPTHGEHGKHATETESPGIE